MWAQHGEEAEAFGWSMHILYFSRKERFSHILLGIVRLEKWHISPFGMQESLTISLENHPENELTIECLLSQLCSCQILMSEQYSHKIFSKKYPENISLNRIFKISFVLIYFRF